MCNLILVGYVAAMTALFTAIGVVILIDRRRTRKQRNGQLVRQLSLLDAMEGANARWEAKSRHRRRLKNA